MKNKKKEWLSSIYKPKCPYGKIKSVTVDGVKYQVLPPLSNGFTEGLRVSAQEIISYYMNNKPLIEKES
jgi:hypothetical protein